MNKYVVGVLITSLSLFAVYADEPKTTHRCTHEYRANPAAVNITPGHGDYRIMLINYLVLPIIGITLRCLDQYEPIIFGGI